MREDEIATLRNTFLVSALTLQKYSHNTLELNKRLALIFGALEPAEMRNFIHFIGVYFFELVDIEEKEFVTLLKQLPKATKGSVMTLYESILQKGIEKGIEKGRLEGIEKSQTQVVQNCHTNGLSIQMISNITGLTDEEVQHLLEIQ